MSVIFVDYSKITLAMEKLLTLTERKRLDILRAAQEEFKENGFLGASMDSIAKRAEVSKRTVYNHFPSKEKLFHAIVKQLCDTFTQAANTEYQSDCSLEEQLMTVATRELTLLKSEKFRDLNRITLAELIRSPELASSTQEYLDQKKGGFNMWVSAAISDGRLKSVDVNYAAQIFIGLIKSTVFWPQLLMTQGFPTLEQQKTIAEDAVFMFLARYEIK
ncbi:MAG: TetR/AcrR family transcriptional regulator [Colwellia sp.]